MNLRRIGLSLFSIATLLAAFACSSSDAAPPTTPPAEDSGVGSPSDDAQVEPTSDAGTHADASDAGPSLSCATHSWCTTYNVRTYHVSVPAPAGGSLKDGLYRLAYVLIPTDREPDSYTEYVDAFLVKGSEILWISDSAGWVGSFSSAPTSATSLSVTRSGGCDAFGPGGVVAAGKSTIQFSATDDAVTIFHDVTSLGDGGTWSDAYVYERLSSDDLCAGAVSADPATPAPSFKCRVANCVCAEAHGALTKDACPYIH